MNCADSSGVCSVTELGGCHVLWIDPDMSLQYGEGVRGAATSRLSWKSWSSSAGKSSFTLGWSYPASLAGMFCVISALRPCISGLVMHSAASVANSYLDEKALTPMPMPP